MNSTKLRWLALDGAFFVNRRLQNQTETMTTLKVNSCGVEDEAKLKLQEVTIPDILFSFIHNNNQQLKSYFQQNSTKNYLVSHTKIETSAYVLLLK